MGTFPAGCCGSQHPELLLFSCPDTLGALERSTQTDEPFPKRAPAPWQEGLTPSGKLVKATGQTPGSLEEGQQHLNYAEVKPGFIKTINNK